MSKILRTFTCQLKSANDINSRRVTFRAEDKRHLRVLVQKAQEDKKIEWYSWPEEKPVGPFTLIEARLLCEDTALEHFFAGTPATLLHAVFNRNVASGGWFGGGLRRGGPIADAGEWQFWYDDDGVFYSYKMPLAQWVKNTSGEKTLLVNGDGAPTVRTAHHQRVLRDALVKREWRNHRWHTGPTLVPHALVPFSVLERAGIRPENVVITATTEERNLRRQVWRKNEEGVMEKMWVSVHFLGETLFTNSATGRVYVCGLDRNDDPNKRSFYLAEVPVDGSAYPSTVDEALMLLRPAKLSRSAKRQGEWFFVPVKSYKKPKIEGAVVYAKRVPIVEEDAEKQRDGMHAGASFRQDRHVATEMVVNGAVYVRGMIRDAEHTALKLGKTWHKVVKNRAVAGWRYVSEGDARGSRVD